MENSDVTDKPVVTQTSDLAVVTSHQSWCTCKPCNRAKLDKALNEDDRKELPKTLRTGNDTKDGKTLMRTKYYRPENWYKNYKPEDKIKRYREDIEDKLRDIRVMTIQLNKLYYSLEQAIDEKDAEDAIGTYETIE